MIYLLIFAIPIILTIRFKKQEKEYSEKLSKMTYKELRSEYLENF